MWRYSSTDWICWFFFFFLSCKLKPVGDLGEAVVLERVMQFSCCRERSARKEVVVLLIMGLWIFHCNEWSVGVELSPMLWAVTFLTTGTPWQSCCFSKKIQPPEQILWMDTVSIGVKSLSTATVKYAPSRNLPLRPPHATTLDVAGYKPGLKSSHPRNTHPHIISSDFPLLFYLEPSRVSDCPSQTSRYVTSQIFSQRHACCSYLSLLLSFSWTEDPVWWSWKGPWVWGPGPGPLPPSLAGWPGLVFLGRERKRAGRSCRSAVDVT